MIFKPGGGIIRLEALNSQIKGLCKSIFFSEFLHSFRIFFFFNFQFNSNLFILHDKLNKSAAPPASSKS